MRPPARWRRSTLSALARSATVSAVLSATLAAGTFAPSAAGSPNLAGSPSIARSHSLTGSPNLGGSPSAAGSPSTAAPTDEAGLVIGLDALEPAIPAPGDTVAISGHLTNATDTPLTLADVVVSGSNTPLAGRDAVAAWAQDAPGAGVFATAWASLPLDGQLAPGASRTFTITLPATATALPGPFGALPVAIESGAARLTTFLPIHDHREYTPLTVAVAVPLTLGPHSALFGPSGPERTSAWTAELGPTGRLTKLLDATSDLRVSYVIDPTLTAAPRATPRA